MDHGTKPNLYKSSGVDVSKGDKLVEWLQNEEKDQKNTGGEVISGIGGFSALFRPNFSHMEDPLLVSGTDGVGTKVLLGLQYNLLEGLGIDLVAMCVNDLYTIGAQPLFFLDYYATGHLDENQFKEILSGIKKGLSHSKTILLGGETAELPGLYEKGHFDLAGFVVGAVDAPKRLTPELVKPSDHLIAIHSSGFHSNGYSLVRKWLTEKEVDESMINKIMAPTQIYGNIPELLEKVGHGKVHALANITGGGISGNLPRVMPNGIVCEIEKEKIPTPDWMIQFCEDNNASFEDVEAVFNMGAGMIAAVSKEHSDEILEEMAKLGMPGTFIGKVKEGENKPYVVYK